MDYKVGSYVKPKNFPLRGGLKRIDTTERHIRQ